LGLDVTNLGSIVNSHESTDIFKKHSECSGFSGVFGKLPLRHFTGLKVGGGEELEGELVSLMMMVCFCEGGEVGRKYLKE
jgi:hypothetical protein